jgi:hypothetical protein
MVDSIVISGLIGVFVGFFYSGLFFRQFESLFTLKNKNQYLAQKSIFLRSSILFSTARYVLLSVFLFFLITKLKINVEFFTIAFIGSFLLVVYIKGAKKVLSQRNLD